MPSFLLLDYDRIWNQAASQTILGIRIPDGKDGLILMLDFAASWYEVESMIRFMKLLWALKKKLKKKGFDGIVRRKR